MGGELSVRGGGVKLYKRHRPEGGRLYIIRKTEPRTPVWMSLRKTWLIGKPRTAVEVEVVAAAAVAVAAVAVAVAAVAAVAAAVAAAAVVAVAAKKVLAAARNNDADVLLICQDIPDKEFCANQKR
jgi:hypothetical protein